MELKSLQDEQWREYEFGGRIYRIDEPISLAVGATTHRVIGPGNIVHCLPAPGFHGCALRWCPKPGKNPVAF